MKKILSNQYIKGVFLLVMAALLYASFFDYSVNNERRIKNNLKSITEENNQQTNVAVSEKLEDEIHILESYASLISYQDDITSDAAFQELEPLLDTELFSRVAVTNAKGISYTSDHFQHDTRDRDYYIEGMKGNTCISNNTKSVVDQSDVIVISVPVYKQKSIIGVLRATIDTKVLHEYFELSFLSGNVSSFLIQRDGLNLTPQGDNDHNFFTMLESHHNESSLITKMKEDLARGKAGSITFLLNDKVRYAYYSPVAHTSWFMLTILPYATVEAETDFDFQQTLLLAGKITAILLVTYIYFFYLQVKGSRAVKQMNKQMDAIISNTPGTSYKHELDKPETIVFFKEDKRLLAGYSKEEILTLIKEDIDQLIFKDDLDVLYTSLGNCEVNAVISNTYRIRNKQNEVQWFFDQRQVIQEGNKLFYYVEVLDITGMKMTQEQLKISEERYQLILRETESVIFEWNMYIDQITFSDLWTSKYGYPNVLDHFLTLTNQYFENQPHSYIPLIEHIVAGATESDQIECILPKADGEEVWVRIFAKAILDDQGYLLRLVGSISDINQEKQESMQLLERAQRDGLTRVYNRITLEHLVGVELAAHSNMAHIMFVIDIDDFKSINDTLGHACGDEALMKFSEALKSCFRKEDAVGRIGGDEFVVFMRYPGENIEEQIERKCEMFLSAISRIRLSQNDAYQMRCSIGVSMYPHDGNSYAELFRYADKRLYQAKKNGKNTFTYHDEIEQ